MTTVSFIMVDNGSNNSGGVSNSAMQMLKIEVLPQTNEHEVSCSTGTGKGFPWLLAALLAPMVIIAWRTRATA